MIFSGHPNILATHKTTIEFTKDSYLTKKGDCILGIKTQYDLDELKKTVNQYSKIKLIIKVKDITDEIIAFTNKEFNNENEFVIRTTDFISERTLAIKADKAALDIKRELVSELQKDFKGSIEIIGLE